MIELLVAYLLYEGGASWEWWVCFIALLAIKTSYIFKQMKREEEEQMVIKKIITLDEKDRNSSSNH
jgi:hypothetical protein